MQGGLAMGLDNTSQTQHVHDRHEAKEHLLERHSAVSHEVAQHLQERSSVQTMRDMESADRRPSLAQCSDFALTGGGRVIAEYQGRHSSSDSPHAEAANAPGSRAGRPESLDALSQMASQNPELAVKLADSNPALLDVLASQSVALDSKLAATDPGLALDLASNDPLVAARLKAFNSASS
jgi:hypothetical protein